MYNNNKRNKKFNIAIRIEANIELNFQSMYFNTIRNKSKMKIFILHLLYDKWA